MTQTTLRVRIKSRRARRAGLDEKSFERHLTNDLVIAPENATPRHAFEALARVVRDAIAPRWIETEGTIQQKNAKRVHLLSMEHLPGRALAGHVANLGLSKDFARLCKKVGIDPAAILEEERDAALGAASAGGALGRAASCLLDSMAAAGIPATGHGLRYESADSHATLRDGWQSLASDTWLSRPDPWEVARPGEAVEVKLGCSFSMDGGSLSWIPGRPTSWLGVPHDRPIVGFGGRMVNTLRLWAARAPESLDSPEAGPVAAALAAEAVTRVLCPAGSPGAAQGIRFLQEAFLAMCALGDLVRRFQAAGNPWSSLPKKAAIEMNDIHPAFAVPELMRILLDEAKLSWEESWDLTVRTISQTQHSLEPEALEKWPVGWFEMAFPRHLEIVYEINGRFLETVRGRFPGDDERVRRASLIDESGDRAVRLAPLAIVGSHTTAAAGVRRARILASATLPDNAATLAERFRTVPEGISQRRFLLVSNPPLAEAVSDAIGDRWITDPSQLSRLKRLAKNKRFQNAIRKAKRASKAELAAWIERTTGREIDPDSIFDSQAQPIGGSNRQLLNALRIAAQYQRFVANPKLADAPRTFLIVGKAAAGDRTGQLVVKLLHRLAEVIDGDRALRGRMKVVVIPDSRVSTVARVLAASDVSNSISTAGHGGNGMLAVAAAMNGALTVGSRDGVVLDIAQAAGPENVVLFGLTAEEMAADASTFDPMWHFENEAEARAAFELLASERFHGGDSALFAPIAELLLQRADRHRHLADLKSFCDAHRRVGELHGNRDAWYRKVVSNLAAAGDFSSDRAVAIYAKETWRAPECKIPK
jgi:starch phosphorylase